MLVNAEPISHDPCHATPLCFILNHQFLIKQIPQHQLPFSVSFSAAPTRGRVPSINFPQTGIISPPPAPVCLIGYFSLVDLHTDHQLVSSNIDTPEMEKPENVVCVFCGSSFGTQTQYAELASELGAKLLTNGFGIVYGGGTTGLMGTIAKSAVSNGGYVHGIIPDALITRERATPDLNEKLKQSIENHTGVTPIPDVNEYGMTTIVKDMHTRKRKMSDEANCGFILMPGGYGTLEELMEMTTWNQLGIHQKPIVIFNMNGFYDKLIEFLQGAIANGFISESNGKILVIANTADEVVDGIRNYVVPEGRYSLNWESVGTTTS